MSDRWRFLLSSVLYLAIAAWAPQGRAADTYDMATLVEITATGEDNVKLLYDRHIDIVGRRGDVYKALLRGDELRLLQDRGLKVEILYAEMQSDRARWAEAALSHELATSYYTPSKFNTTNPPAGSLMEHLLQLYNAHPDITRLYNLGASQDGAYDIIAMKVTRNPDAVEPEPKIRLYANIHGDEKGGVMVTCDVLDTILAGYTSGPPDPTAQRLVDETEMWFIPIGNPYGNANNTRYNSRSVDLNRNFWGPAGSDAPPAWSEKETQVIRDLTETATAAHSKKRFALSISFHEGEVVFNSVWNYTTAAPTDEPIFWSSRTGGSGCGGQTIPNCPTLAPHGLAQAYKDGCSSPGFWYSEGYDWYGTRGDTNDWAYGAWSALDTTVELNTTKTPPASSIPTYCAQHRQAVLNYMMKVFQGVHGVMTDQTTGAPLDGTVTATATSSPDLPVPHAYQAVYTDPVIGDFHRILQPGTYTIVCSAPGYMSTTIPGVVVTADSKSTVNCALNATGLRYGSSTFVDSCASGGAGGGDGILDAGEDATVVVTLSNPGSAAATAVQATLSTVAPGITITGNSASFANVPGGGSGASVAPHFQVHVGEGVACGAVIPFSLHLTAAQGAWDDSFSVAVGQTAGGTPQALFSESFDGTTFPPAGWAQVDAGGTAGNWARSTGTVHPAGSVPHTGAGLAYFNSYTASAGASTRLYRTGGVAIPAQATFASVSFWIYHDTGYPAYPDQVQVQASTNGTTWTNVGTPVARYDGSTGWKQHTVSLAPYIGLSGVQLGLLGVSAFGNDCHIDDVQVTYTLPGTCAMHACAAAQNADLSASLSGPASAPANGTIGYSLGVTNGGPGAASNAQLTTATPARTTFVSLDAPAGWNCSTPAAGTTGAVGCAAAALGSGASASFALVVKVDWCAGDGQTVTANATAATATNDANPANNSASAVTSVVDNGACDDGNPCTLTDACQSGACAGTNPVPAPAEVDAGVRVEATGDSALITWNAAAGATSSQVLRGLLSALPVGPGGSDEQCAGELAGTSLTDPAAAPAGDGFWYLVRGVNACAGAGPYGFEFRNGGPSTAESSTTCP